MRRGQCAAGCSIHAVECEQWSTTDLPADSDIVLHFLALLYELTLFILFTL